MKTIAVSFSCTREQQNRLVQAAQGYAQVQFMAEMEEKQAKECMNHAHVIIGQPELAEIAQNEVLEWVQMTWVGTDKYTVKSSEIGFPKHIQLTNMCGALGVIMSEYAIGGILALYRHFPTYWTQQKQGIWKDAGAEESLYGKTVLLLGTGDIGTNLAKRLKAFGTTNIGIRRNTANVPEGFDQMYGFEQLDKLLPEVAGGSAVPEKIHTEKVHQVPQTVVGNHIQQQKAAQCIQQMQSCFLLNHHNL